jgi:hypothetical protein
VYGDFLEVPDYHETAGLIEHQKKSSRKADAAIYITNMRGLLARRRRRRR